jgi:hypothetical protein
MADCCSFSTKKILLIFLSCWLSGSWVYAQSTTPDLADFNAERLRISRVGMAVLGSWAIGNLGLGALRVGQLQGEDKYFHQMNMYWNAVNLALAGFGYYKAATTDDSALSAFASLKEHYGTEKILLLNTGLDVAYIIGGLYLLERGNNHEAGNKRDQFRGFGHSVIVQGGFLLLFDLALYLVQHHHLKRAQHLFEHLTLTGNSAGVILRF